MNGVGDAFPCGDFRSSVNSGDVGEARCAGGYECCFGDEEGAWGGGALGVILQLSHHGRVRRWRGNG